MTPELFYQFCVALNKELMEEPPAVAQAMLGGLIASTIGNMPDDFWKAMMAEAHLPCGIPDCGCEKVKGAVMEALDLLREDFKEQTA
jgi:hypothetical protein